MTKKMAEWSKLKNRIGSDAKDVTMEWHMPLDSNDTLGITAWSRFAVEVGATFVSGKEPGVSWDTPIVAKMKRSLAWAVSAEATASEADKPLLLRVLADLRSYRDTGRSLAGAVAELQAHPDVGPSLTGTAAEPDAGSGARGGSRATRGARRR